MWENHRWGVCIGFAAIYACASDSVVSIAVICALCLYSRVSVVVSVLCMYLVVSSWDSAWCWLRGKLIWCTFSGFVVVGCVCVVLWHFWDIVGVQVSR